MHKGFAIIHAHPTARCTDPYIATAVFQDTSDLGQFNPCSTSRHFILMLALSFMSGDKALTGCGHLQGATFPLAGMGTPVGKVSPKELTRTKEEVSTPGVKVFKESLFTGMTVRVSGILCTRWWHGNHPWYACWYNFRFCQIFRIWHGTSGRHRHSRFQGIPQ